MNYDSLFESQNGLCAVCQQGPSGRAHEKNLWVDHSHATGKVRALLCGGCNTALGAVRESQTVCIALAEYIRKHTESDGHHL